jgi:hypothetical protein
MTHHALGLAVMSGWPWILSRRPSVQAALLEVRRHGWRRALYHGLLRAINSVVLFKILRGVWIERVDDAFLTCPERYTAGFLSEKRLRDFSRDPDNGMPESFLDEALSKGDECFALCEGGTLAAYGWYASTPTRIDPPDLLLQFSGEYVYMYKGFTHTRHRGKRLHAIGMTMALQHYLSRGSRGLVSYVESDNFDSLKSVFRMGYAAFGSVYVLRIFGRTLTYSSPGCGTFGFRVGRGSH